MFRRIKKWLCLILVCVMIVPLVSGAVFAVEKDKLAVSNAELPIEPPDHSFTDVHDGRWYSEAVQFVYERDIMQGTSPTTFLPSNTLTRAQIAQVLYNMEGRPLVSFWSSFSDVERGKWYTDAVMWAYIRDIVQGVGDRRFAPMAPITREQIATILYRFAEFRRYDVTISPSATSAFLDAGQISSWAVDGMQWAVHHGLIQGTSAGLLNPRGTATRAQVATILMRFIQRFEMSEDFELTISVEETVLPQNEPFLVNVELKNNSWKDFEIAYSTLFHPDIPGAYWRPPLASPRPTFELIESDGGVISHTIQLDRFFNLLPQGVHELTFSAIFYLDWAQPYDPENESFEWEPPRSARRFEIVSNTVEVTVTKSELPTAEDFELTISMEETTVVQGDDIWVRAELTNNSGQDLEIAYDFLFLPHIPGVLRFPSLRPPWPTIELFESSSTISQLIYLNQHDILLQGTYHLTVEAVFFLGWEQRADFENEPIPWNITDSAQQINVSSNTIMLTVQ